MPHAQVLTLALHDSDSAVREAASKVLSAQAADPTLAATIAAQLDLALRSDETSTAASVALQLLAESGPSNTTLVISILERTLKNLDSSAAAEALANLAAKPALAWYVVPAVPALTAALNSTDSVTSTQAAQALAHLAAKPELAEYVISAAPALQLISDSIDSDRTLRDAANQVMDSLTRRMPPDPPALTLPADVNPLPILYRLLQHRDPNVRAYAIQAIGQIGSTAQTQLPQLPNDLGRILTQQDGAQRDIVRIAAAHTLRRLGSDDLAVAQAAGPYFSSIARSVREPVPIRIAALDDLAVLATIHPALRPSFISDTLFLLSDDRQDAVRAAAARGLRVAAITLHAPQVLIVLDSVLDSHDNDELTIATAETLDQIIAFNPHLADSAVISATQSVLHKSQSQQVRTTLMRVLNQAVAANPALIEQIPTNDIVGRETLVETPLHLIDPKPDLTIEITTLQVLLRSDTPEDGQYALNVIEAMIQAQQTNSDMSVSWLVEGLRGALTNPHSDSELQSRAAELIKQTLAVSRTVATQDLADDLIIVLKTPDNDVQAAAIEALTEVWAAKPSLSVESTSTALTNMLESHPDKRVLLALVRLLTQIGSVDVAHAQTILPMLVDIARVEDDAVYFSSLQAVGYIAGLQDLPPETIDLVQRIINPFRL
jgi:hypothetical protein